MRRGEDLEKISGSQRSTGKGGTLYQSLGNDRPFGFLVYKEGMWRRSMSSRMRGGWLWKWGLRGLFIVVGGVDVWASLTSWTSIVEPSGDSRICLFIPFFASRKRNLPRHHLLSLQDLASTPPSPWTSGGALGEGGKGGPTTILPLNIYFFLFLFF